MEGKQREVNGSNLLAGCFRGKDQKGREQILELDQTSEGNNGTAVIGDFFTATLNRNIGYTFFTMTRWDTYSSFVSGSFYNVFAYNVDKSDPAHWKLSDLGTLENKADMYGFEGDADGKQVTYPYKKKEDVIKRLRKSYRVTEK